MNPRRQMGGSKSHALSHILPSDIRDFFKNEEHGFISDSLAPNVFAGLIERLLIDKDSYDKISLNNYRYAQSHFLASDAASRLEAIYETMLKNQEAKKNG